MPVPLRDRFRRWSFKEFPAELEAEFQAHYRGRSVPMVRAVMLIAVLVYSAFVFWDYIVGSDVFASILPIRVITIIILVGFFLCSTRPWFNRYMQSVLGTPAAVAGISVVWIIDCIPDGLVIGLAGILLVLMFNFGFIRLLFWPSLVSGATTVLAYNVAAAFSALPLPLIAANNFFLASAFFAGGSATYMLEKLARAEFLASRALERERARADSLIENMLPRAIAERLKSGETVIAESHADATVLFADLVGSTALVKALPPPRLIELLNGVFSIMDRLSDKHGVDKIKTAGDCYMAVAGISAPGTDSAARMAGFALDLLDAVAEYGRERGYALALRVGMHTGQVVGGVIGLRKFSYDLWGETVNIASRLEAQSEPGRIQVSEATWQRLRDTHRLVARGPTALRGIGEMQTYYLLAVNTARAGGEYPANDIMRSPESGDFRDASGRISR